MGRDFTKNMGLPLCGSFFSGVSLFTLWLQALPGLVLWFFRPVRLRVFSLNFSRLEYCYLGSALGLTFPVSFLPPSVYLPPVSAFVLSLVLSNSFLCSPACIGVCRRVGPIGAVHRLPVALVGELRRWDQITPLMVPS